MGRQKLKNAPLVHVLAQVVFPPVLQLEELAPTLGQPMSDLGFPRPSRIELHEILMQVGGLEGAPAPRPIRRMQFEFADRDQHTAFVLAESSFVLQTSAYTTSEPFLQLLERGLSLVQKHLGLRLVDRIGLRYVDLVQPESGEPFGDYVHKGLLGYPFREEPKLKATRGAFATQSVAVTPTGTLAIRSAVLEPGQYLPPDLQPTNLRRPTNVKLNRSGLAVDFDHFTLFHGPEASSVDFDVSFISAHVDRLHTTLRDAFDAIVTPYAIERWGPWEEVATA
jgi:uncharacterized protein (TIGR04255 family)